MRKWTTKETAPKGAQETTMRQYAALMDEKERLRAALTIIANGAVHKRGGAPSWPDYAIRVLAEQSEGTDTDDLTQHLFGDG